MSEFIERHWKILAGIAGLILFVLLAPWWLVGLALVGYGAYLYVMRDEVPIDTWDDDEDDIDPPTKAA